MDPHENASGVKLAMPNDSMEVNKKNDDHSVVSMSKLKLACVFLINNLLVLLFVVMLHYVLPTTDSVTQEPGSTTNENTNGIQMSQLTAKALANGTEVPLGTIVAWIPSPKPTWIPAIELPVGWQICNGSVITDNRSPWVGQDMPDLTDRFLRGGNTSHFLVYEEDQMQDHQHVDRGHTHLDEGHSHNDSGHNHTDSGHTHTDYGHTHIDEGHGHTDTGHEHTDAGHDHDYTDNTVFSYVPSGGDWTDEGDAYGPQDASDTTASAAANIQTGYAVITDGNANIAISSANISREQAIILSSSAVISTSQAILSNATSNMQGVDPGVDGARVGSETRPKSTYIVWIMKVFEPV